MPLVLFFFSILGSYTAQRIADVKNRSTARWGIATFLCTPLVFLILCMPELEPKQEVFS